MNTLLMFLETLGRTSLVAWWLPLAVWSAVAAAGYLLLRRWRKAHPYILVRAHQALLFALPLAFVAAAFVPFASPFEAPIAAAPDFPPVVAMDLPVGTEALLAQEAQMPTPLDARSMVVPTHAFAWGFVGLGGLLVLALSVAGGLLLHLIVQSIAIRRYARTRPRLVNHTIHLLVAELARKQDIRRNVRVLRGTATDVPMTFGWLRPTILLPPAVLDDSEALDLTLRHELAHIARHDYAWNLAEACVTRLFAITPVAAILSRQIDQHREAVCDHTVLTSPGTSLRRYASLLLSFQHVAPRHGAHALRMAQPGDDLKQRIHTMKTFRHIPFSRALRSQRLRVVVALLLLPMLLTACNIDFPSFKSDDAGAEQLERLELQVAYLKDRLEQNTDPIRRSTLAAMYQEAMYEYEALRMEMTIDAQLNRREVVVVEQIANDASDQVLRELKQRIEVIQAAIEATSAELYDFYVTTPDAQQNPAAHPYALERTQRLEQLQQELRVLVERQVRVAARMAEQQQSAARYQVKVNPATSATQAQYAQAEQRQAQQISSDASRALLMAKGTVLKKQVESLQARIAELELVRLEMQTRTPTVSESQQTMIDLRSEQVDKLRAQMEALVMELADLDQRYRNQ